MGCNYWYMALLRLFSWVIVEDGYVSFITSHKRLCNHFSITLFWDQSAQTTKFTEVVERSIVLLAEYDWTILYLDTFGSWWRLQMEIFSASLALCVRGIHRSLANSPHKCQWRGTLMLSLNCSWKNSWAINREAGDLRRHPANYDVIVMLKLIELYTYICNIYVTKHNVCLYYRVCPIRFALMVGLQWFCLCYNFVRIDLV